MASRRYAPLLGLLVAFLAWSPAPGADEKGKPAVKVEVDTSDAPEAAWAKKAKLLIEKWHPKMVKMLESDGFVPADEVKLIFVKEIKQKGVVAFASGSSITVSVDHLRRNPLDFGVVIHEHAHVLQRYAPGYPGWLGEAIADHVRFNHYEPKARVPIDLRKANYTDGYGPAARFLGWVEKTYDKTFVKRLNAALRKGEYKEEMFKEATKKSLDQLWLAFLAAEERAIRRGLR